MRSSSPIKCVQWLYGSVADIMLSFAHYVPKSLSLERENNCHLKSADHWTSQFIGGGRKMYRSVDWQGTETTDITTGNSITNYTAMCSITDESNCWNQGKSCVFLKIHSEWCVQETVSMPNPHIWAHFGSYLIDSFQSSSWIPQELWSIGPCPWTSLQMFPGFAFESDMREWESMQEV